MKNVNRKLKKVTAVFLALVLILPMGTFVYASDETQEIEVTEPEMELEVTEVEVPETEAEVTEAETEAVAVVSEEETEVPEIEETEEEAYVIADSGNKIPISDILTREDLGDFWYDCFNDDWFFHEKINGEVVITKSGFANVGGLSVGDVTYLTKELLSYMVNLQQLNVSENQLTEFNIDLDINIKLWELKLYDNKLQSIVLEGSGGVLEYLDISGNPDISDWSFLTSLSNLKTFKFDNCGVTLEDIWEYLPENYKNSIKDPTPTPTPIPTPTTPTSTTVSVASASSVKISWTKAADVDGYEIYQATSKSGSYKLVKTTTSTSYTQTSLNAGTTYYYKVRSYKTIDGQTVYSDYTTITSKKLTVPTPTKVKLTNSSANSVKVSWDKVTNASGYQIYRATSKNGSYKNVKTVTSGSTISYTDKSLTNNKTYYYKVRAYKTVDGVKKYSSFCSIISKKVALAKTTVTATAKSNTSIKLSWTKVAGAKSYEIYQATSKNGTYKKVKTTTSLSYTNTSLKSNKTYYYKVKAVQTVSKKTYKSAYSTVSSAKTKK